ncbi:unnamed protein product, partial [Prorocentrum cordatum]
AFQRRSRPTSGVGSGALAPMAVLPLAALAAPATPQQPTVQLPCVLRGRAPLEDTDGLPYQSRDSRARHLE